VGRESVWVRKRVPAATTRRERVEGEGVGVGEGRRRDIRRAKQPPVGLDGGDGSGKLSSSSAIGASFSICGPILRRCLLPRH